MIFRDDEKDAAAFAKERMGTKKEAEREVTGWPRAAG